VTPITTADALAAETATVHHASTVSTWQAALGADRVPTAKCSRTGERFNSEENKMNKTHTGSAIVGCLLLLGGPVSHAAEYLQTDDPALSALPFSEAVRSNGMLYLSGQIGVLPGTTKLAPGGIQGETKQVMENLRAALERHGSSLAKVVKCTVMIDDIADWPAFNEIYVTYFPGPKPARSAFGADGLAFGAKVELECLAET
jgi:reactive intermediate/imine deaminase